MYLETPQIKSLARKIHDSYAKYTMYEYALNSFLKLGSTWSKLHNISEAEFELHILYISLMHINVYLNLFLSYR